MKRAGILPLLYPPYKALFSPFVQPFRALVWQGLVQSGGGERLDTGDVAVLIPQLSSKKSPGLSFLLTAPDSDLSDSAISDPKSTEIFD